MRPIKTRVHLDLFLFFLPELVVKFNGLYLFSVCNIFIIVAKELLFFSVSSADQVSGTTFSSNLTDFSI